MQPVYIIPARGGSKGIPGKNLILFNGKPLLLWTVEAAIGAARAGPVAVTTEDKKIAAAAAAGAETVDRPAVLARDTSPTEPAVIHALPEIEDRLSKKFDPVVLLQPTSPLRNSADIDGALGLFEESGADSLLSVCSSHLFLWTRLQDEVRSGRTEKAGADVRNPAVPMNYDFNNRPRRQEMGQFAENGAIYITRRELYTRATCRLGGKIVLYEMPQERSVEIDSMFDLQLAEKQKDSSGKQ